MRVYVWANIRIIHIVLTMCLYQAVKRMPHACPCYVYVTSLVECYEMVLAIIMSVPENVRDECYRTCFRYLQQCYRGY